MDKIFYEEPAPTPEEVERDRLVSEAVLTLNLRTVCAKCDHKHCINQVVTNKSGHSMAPKCAEP